MDVESLKQRTPSYVFEQWKIYWRMQRWGEEWQQAAQMTAATLKTDKPIRDFMPQYKPPEKNPQAAVDRTNAILDQYLAAHNARRK